MVEVVPLASPIPDHRIIGDATPITESKVQAPDDSKVPWYLVLRGLRGIAIATKAPEVDVEFITQRLGRKTGANLCDQAQIDGDTVFSLREWLTRITTANLEEISQHRAKIAVALGFLIHAGRFNIPVPAEDLDLVWDLIRNALANTSIAYTVSRSASGFLAVPLWSLTKDGNVDELFRLHVWLPDGKRGIDDFAIHAHQTFAQGYILTGEGRNITFTVSPVDGDTATHSEYDVSWTDSDGKKTSETYKTHQKSSIVVNTGKLCRVVRDTSNIHSRNMSYTVTEGVFHKSEVDPDVLHATLFFFDSLRGFQQIAPVIGPVQTESYIQQRDPAGSTAAELVKMVDSVRTCEKFYKQGLQHSRDGEWEEALQSLRSALHVYEIAPELLNPLQYKYSILGEIGHMYRMLGRYELASKTLEDALLEMPRNQQRVKITGEIAVVYRHMDRLEDAKLACEDEYSTSKDLGLDQNTCRAIGNLGMINYQLFLQSKDMTLLDMAISQLTERVDRTRKLKTDALVQVEDPIARERLIESASVWEAIALARLSLCFTEKGDSEQAIRTSLESLEITQTQKDPTKTAFSRFFYGRALLAGGQTKEALAQFNPINTCTPTIALCKEPSSEHREYIREMIRAGADMELRDEQGYSALECAIYNGDTETQLVVEEGLRLKHGSEAETTLEQLRYEGLLRKGYREIFQDQLRPVLLHADSDQSLQSLRRVYAEALAQDEQKEIMFDQLKFMRYSDFQQCGKLPRSSDNSARHLTSGNEYIIFLSYRWIANTDGAVSVTPDDIHNTQYNRMIRALEAFLILHPTVERENVCIWIVSISSFVVYWL
jgi:tetratricopeptide (TPR) repeat protein